MPKVRLNAYFDPDLFDRLEAMATSRRVPKTHIVEAALASFLRPSGSGWRRRRPAGRASRSVRWVQA